MPSLPFSALTSRLEGPDDGVWRVHYEAVARAEAGEDIVLMSVGDPDFATPEDIIETLVTQIRNGRTHYSPAAGEPELRRAIAELESRGTARQFTEDNFVILPGATAGIYATLACICDPGDDVIIPEPMYIGYRAIISALGINCVSVDLDVTAGGIFALEDLLAKVTSKTKAVLVNTPGNPVGNILPPELLKELAGALLAQGVWLICDEVYSLFTYDEPHISLLKCAESLDNIVVVDGLSKSHAMTGWRIGWVASPPEMTDALTAYCGSAFFGCSQFIQDAAAYALRHNSAHVQRMSDAYRTRRDYVLKRLDQIDKLSYARPKAGMFVMMDVSRITNDGDVFADGLLAEAGVSVIPGRGFGENTRQYVRLGLTQSLEMIEQAMDRIARYVGES
jgi:arginine:pyruvate transaminase